MLRHILRPEYIHKTPALLAEDLDVSTRRWPGTTTIPDFSRDLFMIYPAATEVANGGRNYPALREFFASNKAVQRQKIIAMGLPAPAVYLSNQVIPWGTPGPFVVRPLTHMKGEEFRVVSDPRGIPQDHYLSPIYAKEREYRLLYVKGELILMWQKDPGRKQPDQAWSNVDFLTIERKGDSFLFSRTDARARLAACPIIRNAHIVGVDVMYRSTGAHTGDWSVVEFNTCPSLTHSAENRREVCEFIRNNW
jgi:hypothetical protein